MDPDPAPTAAKAIADAAPTAAGELAAITVDPGHHEGFVTPWRGAAGRAAAVYRPSNNAELLSVIHHARSRSPETRIVAQGANTGLVGAGVPDLSGSMIVLSTHGLTNRCDIDPLNRSAVVSAGVHLSTLNAAAADHGLRLPIDLSSDPTIGGLISTNAGGSLVMRYGTMRRSVLGLEVAVADPEPRIIDMLGGLRKDSRGPELWAPFVGANGQFGVVTAACVELVPMAHDRATAFIAANDFAEAIEIVGRLSATLGPHLVAFEMISANAMAMTTSTIDGVRAPFPVSSNDAAFAHGPITCLAEVETFGPTRANDMLGDALLKAGCGTALSVPSEDAWHLRHSISEGLARSGRVLGFDVGTAVSKLPSLRDAIAEAVALHVPEGVLAEFGHGGDGGLHCNIVVPDGSVSVERERSVRDLIYGVVADAGGSFSSEHGIGPSNAHWWRALTAPDTLDLWARTKSLFDPTNLFGHAL